MFSRIESRAKAFTVTIGVPIKIRSKKKRILGKENFREKQEQTLVVYLPTTFSFVHSFNDYIECVFNKPDPKLTTRDM